MKQGVVHSSQMVASGSPNWWSISQPPDLHHQHVNQSQHHQLTPPLTGDDDDHIQDLPETNWSQLLLGGLVGEDQDEDEDEDKTRSHVMMRDMHSKKLETWEQQYMNQHNISSSINISTCGADVIKQENSYEYGGKVVPAVINSWSQSYQNNKMLLSSSVSSPKSCVTNTSLSPNNNMLDFSHKSSSGKLSVDPSSHECKSTATGGVAKKAKMIQHSSAQSTFKVRKEKLGDRITALHQLVSPFGKTDTASVLLEAIGYIRFLQNQIEALSVPYLGTGRESTNNSTHQHPHHHIQGNGNSLFPEDPGQLLNKKCIIERKAATKLSDEEEVVKTVLANKDLRSRGLCLVPISSMLNVGSHEMNNGADYWAPSFAAGNFNNY